MLPRDTADVEPIDLSIGIESESESEPFPPSIEYYTHREGAEQLAKNLSTSGYDVNPDDFPEDVGLAWETVHSITHTGTHMDAPWHYGPQSEGKPAKTIEEVPIGWCYGHAVILDFRWKEPGSEITPEEIDTELSNLEYSLSSDDIVLIQTGADELWGTPEYLTDFPGMGSEATKHLVEQGVNVIGTDAYGFDKPFTEMGRRFETTGDEDELWPAHLAGRDAEYCQIEKMANLDQLPRQTDIPLVAFPIKIENASGGWVRPVAFIENDT